MVAVTDRHQVLIDGLCGKVVAVVGLGKSGLAAAHLLGAAGAHVRLVDQKIESDYVSPFTATIRSPACTPNASDGPPAMGTTTTTVSF